ncbi:hypothetical protein B0H10DRAFT_1955719 [Mycena sp. CBHHK59/15]|nr:hypothetical protein B0H10DRAFT_1955719 [Mycena sp. CBHHK59/15]
MANIIKLCSGVALQPGSTIAQQVVGWTKQMQQAMGGEAVCTAGRKQCVHNIYQAVGPHGQWAVGRQREGGKCERGSIASEVGMGIAGPVDVVVVAGWWIQQVEELWRLGQAVEGGCGADSLTERSNFEARKYWGMGWHSGDGIYEHPRVCKRLYTMSREMAERQLAKIGQKPKFGPEKADCRWGNLSRHWETWYGMYERGDHQCRHQRSAEGKEF